MSVKTALREVQNARGAHDVPAPPETGSLHERQAEWAGIGLCPLRFSWAGVPLTSGTALVGGIVGKLVPFKSGEDILKVDPRFVGLAAVRDGVVRQMDLTDHHAAVAGIQLNGSVPGDVRTVFDRARSILLYVYFDYDLLVVGEAQAFGAVEMALKHRLDGHGDATRGPLRGEPCAT
jgi:hypothetical protein